MRKAFLYGLSLAMLLSLAACHKPQAGQQDTSQPDPATTSTSADVSSPEPVKDTPDTEPPVTPAPEPVKDTAPEPEAPEVSIPEPPADPAPVVEPKPEPTPEPKPEQPPVASVKKDTPKPTEEPPTPDPVEPEEPEESEEQPSDTSQAPQTQDQPKLSAKERVENSEAFKNLQEKFPGTWVDDYGGIHSPVANGDSGDILG